MEIRKTDSTLEIKAKEVANQILDINDYLQENIRQMNYSTELGLKELVKSGMEINRNIIDGKYAHSQNERIEKFADSLKESESSRFWVDRLADKGIISEKCHVDLSSKLHDVSQILVSSIMATKESMKVKQEEGEKEKEIRKQGIKMK